MFDRIITSIGVSLIVATAASAMPNGTYSETAEGYNLTARVSGSTINIVVTTIGCIGAGEGQLRQVGEKIWQAYLTEYGETCVVQINDMENSYYMQEVQGCSTFHGQKCGFGGTLPK